jgi:hypothetical protein
MMMRAGFEDRANGRPIVVTSFEDAQGYRCVDIIRRPDGMFIFKEFRRDPEDEGRWTLIGDYSHQLHPTRENALRAAAQTLAWFAAMAGSSRR